VAVSSSTRTALRCVRRSSGPTSERPRRRRSCAPLSVTTRLTGSLGTASPPPTTSPSSCGWLATSPTSWARAYRAIGHKDYVTSADGHHRHRTSPTPPRLPCYEIANRCWSDELFAASGPRLISRLGALVVGRTSDPLGQLTSALRRSWDYDATPSSPGAETTMAAAGVGCISPGQPGTSAGRVSAGTHATTRPRCSIPCAVLHLPTSSLEWFVPTAHDAGGGRHVDWLRDQSAR